MLRVFPLHCCLVWWSVAGADVHLFVSPSGSDNNKGLTSSQPLQSLTKALSRLTEADVKDHAVHIELMGGYHEVAQTLTFSKDHGRPIMIRAHNSEEVHVTGGKKIGTHVFHSVTDMHALQKLPASAHGKVRQVRLSDVGITHAQIGHLTKFGAYNKRTAPLELFYNGKPLQLARWPNDGSYIDVVSSPDGQHSKRFTYPSSVSHRADKWKNEADLWLYGYWYWGWADDSTHVASIDTAHKTITIDTPLYAGMRPGHVEQGASYGFSQQGGYFYVFNALSELDQEGEYYLDSAAGILYIWPPEHSGTISSGDLIYASMVNTLFQFSHVSNITLQNLVLEDCRFMAIDGDHLHSMTFENLEIKNTGSYGMRLTESISVNIRQCEIHDGDGGIEIDGGDRTHLTPSNNIIENNHIWDFSRAAAVGHHGVRIGGVGSQVQYNHIHHGRYTAIWWSGNDHVISRNHVHHMCTGSSDCGGIHSGRDWTWRGNVVSENHIHHVLRYVPGAHVRGIMLDDQYSSVTIQHNIFHNNEIDVNIGGGRDNIIRYNVFYNSTSTGVALDGRGLLQPAYLPLLYSRLKAVPYNDSVWSHKYPNLAAISDGNPNQPKGNQIYKNIFYPGSSGSKIRYEYGDIHHVEDYDIKENLLYANALDFNYPGKGDYRVICETATWATGEGFSQPLTEVEVGPRVKYGPTFKHGTFPGNINSDLRHDCHPSTVASASHTPRSPFVNDGSKPNTKTEHFGCWLITTGCPKMSHMAGKHRDTEGEQHHHALESESACLSRAAVQWKACGSPHAHPVNAIYGPTGAETFAGAGCYMADYGCPAHGYTNAGSLHRDDWAEEHLNAAHNEEHCLKRAYSQWVYCGSKPDYAVVSIYRPTGAIRMAGYGCWIKITKCPHDPHRKLMFFDAWGDTNRDTGADEDSCLERATDYWHHCGSVHAYPVTAYYRPQASSRTVPPN